jgi:hypothetical protein
MSESPVQNPSPPARTEEPNEFERLAAEPSPGWLAEFFDFLAHNKKWWLTPIVVVLLLFGLLIWLGGTSAAPFIYTLF